MTPKAKFDIIAALATPSSPAPRAVLRLSGDGLIASLQAVLPITESLCAKRGAFVVRLLLGGIPPIRAEILCFPGPNSVTGEDVVEVHFPGAPPLQKALLDYVLTHGTRLAEAGEFTRRAFFHGKIDLTQAEAVLELVESRSTEAAQSAAQLLNGALGETLQQCREVLLQALVELEAGLDFEEGDSQDLQPGEVTSLLQRAVAALEQGLQSEVRRQQRQGDRFRIALLGPPNAGKTTLFQRLTGCPSLISAEAGTTRDVRAADWQQLGLEQPVCLLDYPGLGGVTVDARDFAARQQAESWQQAVDLVWYCLRADTAVEDLPMRLPTAPCLLVWTQADCGSVLPASDLQLALRQLLGPVEEVVVGQYGKLGENALAAATNRMLQSQEDALAHAGQHSQAHQRALAEALAALRRGQQWDATGGHQDLVAEEIRSALWAMAALVGEATPEEVLDRLFSSFCVGK